MDRSGSTHKTGFAITNTYVALLALVTVLSRAPVCPELTILASSPSKKFFHANSPKISSKAEKIIDITSIVQVRSSSPDMK